MKRSRTSLCMVVGLLASLWILFALLGTRTSGDEAFYRGEPVSFWRAGVKAWAEHPIVREGASETDWMDGPEKLVPWLHEGPGNSPLPLIGADHAAVPVLVELTKDKDAFVRVYAIHSLGKLGSKAQSAVPALLARRYDFADGQCCVQGCGIVDGKPGLSTVFHRAWGTGGSVSQEAGKALRQIDPVAAAKADEN